MKKKLFIPFLVMLVVAVAIFCTSCDIEGLLNNMGSQTEDTGEAPVITGLRTIKAKDGYLTSKEYLYNTNGGQATNPMALGFNEKYYLIIEYSNPSGYSISYVKVNSKKYVATEFASPSDKTATYIEFATKEDAKKEVIEYLVNGVYYVNGSSTTKMSWGKDVSKSIEVSVRPSFKLTLNYMNIDNRKGVSVTTSKTEVKNNVYYQSEVKNVSVLSADYEGQSAVPTKTGGWVFTGWYTHPTEEDTDKSILVGSDSTYDFWCDMTLYAHYRRMYNVEKVSLSEPIEHTYLSGGTEATITFEEGVKLTGKSFSNELYTHNITLEIPDTVTIDSYTVNQTTRSDGMPAYNVSVSSVEYPVVKVDSEAFRAFNTITSVTMGRYVEEIARSAFRKCDAIVDFSFNAGSRLKYIGDFAFENTELLGASSPFTLPDTVEYLGMCAFRYSGWRVTRNAGTGAAGESILRISPNWKYIGYKCFAKTCFRRVVFVAGCHFESQIPEDEGKEDESNYAIGRPTIAYTENRIGAGIFSQCYALSSVVFESNGDDGVNIIPDNCFDAGSWWNKSDKRDGAFQSISYISFGEGLEYIGRKAFYYQTKIPELALPKSLKEVEQQAFYNNTSVTNLNFEHVLQETIEKEGITKALTKDSQLTIVHSGAFANLTNIDVVYITSQYFALYGNGPFRGCNRLKCIILNNIQDGNIPTGYKSSTILNDDGTKKYSKAKGDPIAENDYDIITGHEQSDFLYGTAESGDQERASEKDATTYSSPVRIFCPSEYSEAFKKDLLVGKVVRDNAGKAKAKTKSFADSVFVHPLELLKDYTYYDELTGEDVTVQVAVQEIYKVENGNMKQDIQLGYSLVYWSARSKYIVLPTADNLHLAAGKQIIEVAAYAIPTSVNKLVVPGTYTRFEHDAFNSCTGLQEVVYEDIDKLAYIGEYAFFGTAITSFTGGTGLKVIANHAFKNCKSLIWVDLSETAITNNYNGRTTSSLYQCKYEYEIEDNKDGDYVDCIGSSAFNGCSALTWFYFPEKIAQIRTSTFTGCISLKTVIIPNANINNSTSANDDTCFYEYAQPNSVFDPKYTYQLELYVHPSAQQTHEELLKPEQIKGYSVLSAAPAHP